MTEEKSPIEQLMAALSKFVDHPEVTRKLASEVGGEDVKPAFASRVRKNRNEWTGFAIDLHRAVRKQRGQAPDPDFEKNVARIGRIIEFAVLAGSEDARPKNRRKKGGAA